MNEPIAHIRWTRKSTLCQLPIRADLAPVALSSARKPATCAECIEIKKAREANGPRELYRLIRL